MQTRMKVGVAINETWAFFHEIYAELERRHQVSQFNPRTVATPLFRERINRMAYRRGLEDFLRSNQVVFFEWAGELLAHASHLPKIGRIVTRLHRYEMYNWVDKINWDNIDRIILVSEAKRREFARRFPAQSGKLVVIPESISLDKFQPVERPFQGDLSILCNLTPRKRVYELILAFSDLDLARQGFRLHVGGGRHERFQDYYEALTQLPAKLGIQEQVIFHGRIEDTPAFYRQTDIFISNSYSEGLQVSPMEAIASGCYCLSHHWDGADELLDPADLYLTDQELGQKISAYQNRSSEQQGNLREQQRQRILEHFDARQISARICDLVEETAGM